MKKSITIGTRASKLAMIQTNSVIERLRQSWPGLEVIVEQIHTRGDLNTEAPLTQVGSDGVFVTEIERALQDGRIDLAVHSLKDLPTVQPPGLLIAVVGPREDVRDVMVSGAGEQISAQDFQAQLSRIAEPLRIGTCSLRRTAQIRRLSPDAQILPIRGNVDTRLRKLDAGDYDAIVLAAAGLHRLALSPRLSGRVSYFPIDAVMPAPGQGALALEMRDDPDIRDLLGPIINREIQAATSAERMFMRRLGAGCYLPVAAYGEISDSMLTLRGLVISLDGQHVVRVRQSIRWTAQTGLESAEQLGVSLAEEALARGAHEIISGLDANRTILSPPPAVGMELGEPGHVEMPLVGIRGAASGGRGIAGKRVLVTRAGEQAGTLSDRIRALGGIPIEFPVIRIVPPDDCRPLDGALRRLAEKSSQPYYAWIVFTSANGVNHFFERVRASGNEAQAKSELQRVRVAAIGAATQSALERNGISVDLVPAEFVAESLVEALIADAGRRGETLTGKRVLLARAAEARDVLPNSLQQAGALVDDVAVYRTIPAAGDDETSREVLRMLQEGRVDLLTLTSSSTVRNFMRWLNTVLINGNYPGRPPGSPLPYTNDGDRHESDRVGTTLAVALDSALAFLQQNPHLKIACIGPVTAQTARELGLPVHIEAKESTIEGLFEAICRYEEE